MHLDYYCGKCKWNLFRAALLGRSFELWTRIFCLSRIWFGRQVNRCTDSKKVFLVNRFQLLHASTTYCIFTLKDGDNSGMEQKHWDFRDLTF